MSLLRLGIENVRCIVRAELRLGPGHNFVVGPNGAGKTTILESVHVLGRGRSFRTRQMEKLLRHGADRLSVYGEIGPLGEPGPASDAPAHRVGVGFGSGRLQARVDGQNAEGLAELARLLPVHVIDPRLHQLIEAGPSERRRFVDAGVFHVEHAYLACWRDYRRLLGQRNAALKAGQPDGLVNVWSAPLIEAGEAVDRLRRTYVDGLSRAVRAIAGRLLGRELELRYLSGWRQALSLSEALARSADRDRATGFTQVGPHRADIELRFEQGRVRDEASRGQQKLVAAALVLGQVRELERLTDAAGILLVDDPAAELDRASLGHLLNEVRNLKSQCLISGLQLEPLGAEGADPVFHVEQGQVDPVL